MRSISIHGGNAQARDIRSKRIRNLLGITQAARVQCRKRREEGIEPPMVAPIALLPVIRADLAAFGRSHESDECLSDLKGSIQLKVQIREQHVPTLFQESFRSILA